MSKYQGIARVSVRCEPFPGVNEGVRALSYHPESWLPSGPGSRPLQFKLIRECYADVKRSK